MDKLFEFTLRKQLARQEEKTQALEAELAEMKVTLKGQAVVSQQNIAHQDNSTHTTTTNQTLNVQNNLTFNVFGSEDTSHIDSARIKGILDEILAQLPDPERAALAAVLKTAGVIYCDVEHPENTTCYLPNQKLDKALVKREEGWSVESSKVVMPTMVSQAYNALFGKQPFVDIMKYDPVMRALRDHEGKFKHGNEMRTVLIQCKAMLQKALPTLPVAGDK